MRLVAEEEERRALELAEQEAARKAEEERAMQAAAEAVRRAEEERIAWEEEALEQKEAELAGVVEPVEEAVSQAAADGDASVTEDSADEQEAWEVTSDGWVL